MTDDDLSQDMDNLDQIIGETFMFFATVTDGLVINEAKASDGSPCRCMTIQKVKGTTPSGTEDLCFHEGIVGTLSQTQNAQYCTTKFPLNDAEGFRRHIEKFQSASAACVAEGASTLESRLSCMSRELRKRGQ